MGEAASQPGKTSRDPDPGRIQQVDLQYGSTSYTIGVLESRIVTLCCNRAGVLLVGSSGGLRIARRLSRLQASIRHAKAACLSACVRIVIVFSARLNTYTYLHMYL